MWDTEPRNFPEIIQESETKSETKLYKNQRQNGD